MYLTMRHAVVLVLRALNYSYAYRLDWVVEKHAARDPSVEFDTGEDLAVWLSFRYLAATLS